MKKLILIAVILSAFSSFCAAEIYIDISGGYGFINMKDFNKFVSDTNESNTGLGWDSSLEKISGVMPLSLTIGMGFDFPYVGLTAFYLKNESLMAMQKYDAATRPDDTLAQDIDTNFSAIYSVLGVKKYVLDKKYDFNPYVAVEGGITYGLGNYIYFHEIEGTTNTTTAKKWDFIAPCISGEAGVEWQATKALGISLKAGYKYARSPVEMDVKTTDAAQVVTNSKEDSSVDYSGFYICAGIMWSLTSDNIKDYTEQKNAVKTEPETKPAANPE